MYILYLFNWVLVSQQSKSTSKPNKNSEFSPSHVVKASARPTTCGDVPSGHGHCRTRSWDSWILQSSLTCFFVPLNQLLTTKNQTCRTDFFVDTPLEGGQGWVFFCFLLTLVFQLPAEVCRRKGVFRSPEIKHFKVQRKKCIRTKRSPCLGVPVRPHFSNQRPLIHM